jgi:hypothetical protein
MTPEYFSRILLFRPSKSKILALKPVRQENVKDVARYSHEKPVIRRMEKLLAA